MNMTMRMSVTNCVYGLTIIVMIIIMVMCYWRDSVGFDDKLLFPCLSRLSRRLRMVSSGTTVTSVSEWLGLLREHSLSIEQRGAEDFVKICEKISGPNILASENTNGSINFMPQQNQLLFL